MAHKIIYLSHDEMNNLGYRGLDQIKDTFILMRKDLFKDWKDANKNQGFMEYKMTDKPKAKMTRAEATKLFSEHMPWAKDAEKTIGFYIEAGMLEVVEEKPLIFNDILRSFGISDTKRFQELCEANGYKITKVDPTKHNFVG